jgi:hypothetical protein
VIHARESGTAMSAILTPIRHGAVFRYVNASSSFSLKRLWACCPPAVISPATTRTAAAPALLNVIAPPRDAPRRVNVPTVYAREALFFY